MLMAGDLDMGHARALLSIDAARQITLANEVVAKRLSVRETERLVNRAQADGDAPARARAKSPHAPTGDIERLETELSDRLATRVAIRMRGKGRGQLVVDFADLEQLDGVLERIRGEAR